MAADVMRPHPVTAPTAAELERFERLLGRHLGMGSDPQNRGQLASVLRERVSEQQPGGMDAYLDRLSAGAPEEVRALAETLTVGETFFFRGRDHFRAFTDVVLPERLRVRPDGPLRILSAGCASGEEPYTVAILLAELLPAEVEIDILAVDVNPAALAKAARGRYTAWSLRDLPTGLRERYFQREGSELVLHEDLRRRVRLEERNLLDEALWSPGAYDVIFCRNVFIHFTQKAIKRVVAGLARALAPGGFLFLGHSETLRGVSQAFQLCSTHETFYYRARGGAELPAPAVLAPLPPPRARRPAPKPPALAGQLERARELFLAERYEEAQGELDRLSAEAAAAPEAMLLAAALLSNRGRSTEAEAVCQRLLARDEQNAGAHYLLALCREHTGDAAGARAHARKAAYLEASFSMPHILLGRLARRAGALEEARREFSLALELVAREEGARLLLFGGGFGRDTLVELCRAEHTACEVAR